MRRSTEYKKYGINPDHMKDLGTSVQVGHGRCSILACTIFHYPTTSKCKTCPIPVCPWDVQYMLNDVVRNPGVYRVQEYSLLCAGIWRHVGILHWF